MKGDDQRDCYSSSLCVFTPPTHAFIPNPLCFGGVCTPNPIDWDSNLPDHHNMLPSLIVGI